MMSRQAPVLDSRLPRYQQLHDLFLRAVVDGHWRPGEAIPAEDALAQQHGVAVGTVRKALASLVDGGHLERKQGRGTFVRRGNFGNALARFFRMTDRDGRPVRPASRILSRSHVAANATVAEHLGVADGSEIILLTRLRLVDGVAILAEEIHLRRDLFAPLMTLGLDAFGDLLYPLYESVCGRIVASARETIRFAAPPAGFSEPLGLPPGGPAVVIERVAFGFDHAPLEFRRSYGAADKFSYSIDIR
jgi:GntR family transcriptional regulator